MADKKGKKKAQRATSNVFAMFEEKQVQEFKEAFNMFDQDRDGIIGIEDLRDTYAAMGWGISKAKTAAFGLMDQDRDGTISVDDLREVYNSLGRAPKDAELQAMIAEAPGPINFTMLLTLFGDRLNGTDEEPVMLNAFKMFDADNKGLITRDNLRELLTAQGIPTERLTDQEFNQVLEGAPLDPKGNLDYAAFTKIIKRGKQDDE